METQSLQELVAKQVRVELKKERWSARQAAFAIGWSEVYISRRLRSETAFDLNDLEALAELLNKPVTIFFPASRTLLEESVNPYYRNDATLTCIPHLPPRRLRLAHARIPAGISPSEKKTPMPFPTRAA